MSTRDWTIDRYVRTLISQNLEPPLFTWAEPQTNDAQFKRMARDEFNMLAAA